MSTVEGVRIGAAIPQVFIDSPMNMTWVRDWILRSEALGFDSSFPIVRSESSERDCNSLTMLI